MTQTLAYKGEETKRQTLKRLRDHRLLDQIVQGTYWTGGDEQKGCAVGCLTHNSFGGHAEFPARWGVPVQLAYLIDHLFESLPTEDAVEWPVRIMSAIPAGADLSRVWDQWSYWMLIRVAELAGENRAVVEVMASLFERAGAGDEPTTQEWARAAEAAWAAWAAGAAGAAEAAWAAWAARAAWAVEAVEAARAARAAWAAEAARAVRAARAAARNTWAAAACAELVRLVKAAPRG